MKEADIRPQALFNRYLDLSRRDIERFFADRDGFVEVPCPACESRQFEHGFEKLGFRYLICRACGSLYLSPRPTVEMISAYARDSEAVRFWGTDFFKETAEARREKMFRPRAELVAQTLAERRTGEPGVFVDVGSGYGIFLEEVSRLGMFPEIVAIEPAPNLADTCRHRGFRVVEKFMEQIKPGELEASFVTAFEVLEHLFEPVTFLAAVRGILRPGGLFLLTTLTVSGFDIQVLWERSKSVYPPHHINLMSIDGMECLMRRAGFKVLDLSTPGALDVDIVRNIAREDPNLGLPRFVRRIVDADEAARDAFQDFLRRHRLSSHVRVLASGAGNEAPWRGGGTRP